MTDESIMLFGKHKGKRLIDVPASYLLYLYENDLKPGALRDYITYNLQALKSEK